MDPMPRPHQVLAPSYSNDKSAHSRVPAGPLPVLADKIGPFSVPAGPLDSKAMEPMPVPAQMPAPPSSNDESAHLNAPAGPVQSLAEDKSAHCNVPAGPLEESPPGDKSKPPHHRPFTAFRMARGSFLLFLLIFSAFWAQAALAPLWIVARLCNRHSSRRVSGFFLEFWLGLWVFLFEKVNGTKFVFSGDHVPEKERVLVLMNHLTEVDWMYLWCLAYRKSRLGYVKYAMKSSVRNAPVFGWAFHIMEFLLLDRKWELDQHTIQRTLTSFQDRKDPLWFVLFPEGTDFSEAKKLRSQAFSRAQGLPELHHVLLPRTKGFHAVLTPLRSTLDAVYDLTVGYVYRPPTFLENLFGTDPKEIHINIRRVKLREIPENEDKAGEWLYSTFIKKDGLLAAFYTDGKFPSPSLDAENATNMTKAFLGYPLYLTFSLVFAYLAYTVLWFRLYCTAVVVFLTTIVYLKWMPGGWD